MIAERFTVMEQTEAGPHSWAVKASRKTRVAALEYIARNYEPEARVIVLRHYDHSGAPAQEQVFSQGD